MIYSIYTKPNCIYCDKAKQLIAYKNDMYVENIIGEDISVDEFKQLFPNQKTAPLIIVGDTIIPGYGELTAWYEHLKANLVQRLKGKIPVDVTFTKTNGQIREMRCTLAPEYLPEQTETSGHRESNPDTISVWDMDKADWRSFRIDRVIKFGSHYIGGAH